MRKNIFGRQFKRDTNERKALFKGLISSLILHERIKTTEEKAKSIKAFADKIITKAKKGEEIARYQLRGQIPKNAIDKLIIKIAPRFEKKQGGYTRIVKIGRRFSDNASVVLMEWTEGGQIENREGEKILTAKSDAATVETQNKSEAKKFVTAKVQKRPKTQNK